MSGFATRNTSEYTKVVATKPKVMRHILDQGYNVAWSDADAYWLRNPFTLFDRSPDLVVAWSNASELLEGGAYPAGELLGKLCMSINSHSVAGLIIKELVGDICM